MNIENINKAWRSTCRILLGDEIGDIGEYRDYLLRYIKKRKKVKSAISGKDVVVPLNVKYNRAKFISNDEREQYHKKTGQLKLNINQVKDTDSIIEALNERIYYAGNVILGNSREVYLSNRISNSSFVYESEDIHDSKYIGYSCMVRFGNHLFGCHSGGDGSFGIKILEMYQNTRCMETVRAYTSSDCYYTANIDACNDCMFSFNLRNKRNMIGNLQLTKDKYSALKTKLVAEIRDTLQTKKSVPTLVEIMGGTND
ncbi:hypothetical protein KKF81_02105 [Candidatus Micrarchaeota archaeon]|nr:hypothetical protein [Candidatus Micrarchaeota archaeon]MBU1165714.1 hypothetical protein [Candidatus Micrarchaeota archaeon]MBU1887081.1 hypothetical protein [Candidatus Micrarchaeota archaeon]